MLEMRPAPGFPGYYVTNDGRVWSTHYWRKQHSRGRWMKPQVGNRGYLSLRLKDESGRQRTVTLHSVVAAAFIGPRPDGQQVRHLDGDPLNARVDNLAYGTQSENNRDAVRHGTHWCSRKTHCPKGHPYDEVNTYVNPASGGRMCRTCRKGKGTS